MCDSGSGSGNNSSDTITDCSSTVLPTLTIPSLTPTVSLTPTMDDKEGEMALVTASLAMAVMALIFAVVVTAIAAVMLYLLVKLRREVKGLRYHGSGGAVAKAENGSPHLVSVNILGDPLPHMETEPESLDRKPSPLPPTTGQTVQTTPPQTIPKLPSEDTLAHTAPARVSSPRDAYDNVNLTSILPPELRTEENLEGRPLNLAEVRQLEEAERRKEKSYEEIELSLRRKEEAVAAVRNMVGPAWMKGEELDDVYTNPADAVAGEEEEAVKTAAKKGSLRKKPKKGKGSSEGSESLSPTEHEPGLYTSVFDHLPSGEREVVATRQSTTSCRGTSRSRSPSPHVEKKTPGGGGKRDYCGYEDMEDETFPRSAPCKQSPLLQGAGELDDPVTPRSEGNGKTDLTKRYSHPGGPSRRDREAAKEMVEVNPRSKKPVTLSSGRRKEKLQLRGSDEGVDGGESTDTTISKSAGSSPNAKAKEFNITEGGDGPQNSYAVVNMSGKMRYRAESDEMKKEGSGVPNHYTVKECPPENDTQPVTVNT